MEKLVFDFEIEERNAVTGEITTVYGAGTLFLIENLERSGASIMIDRTSGRMVPAALLDETGRLIV